MNRDTATDAVLEFGAEGGDETLNVHSAILRVASPVIDAMFEAGMKESRCKTIKVSADLASRAQFEEFYAILLPLGSKGLRITKDNVAHLFRISDFYQIEGVRSECVAFLCTLDPTVAWITFAHKHGLKEIYSSMVAKLDTVTKDDLAQAKEFPEVLVDIAEHFASKSGGEKGKGTESKRQTPSRAKAIEARVKIAVKRTLGEYCVRKVNRRIDFGTLSELSDSIDRMPALY
uniref:BTB domain-containing protein n=1 Tax=Zooxanthella nutricula TaxID=1333877 RepID=A0A7S2L2S8_9DINO